MTHANDTETIGDSNRDEHTRTATDRRRSRGGPGGFLISTGILMWIGAGALMSVPTLMPQYAWVFKHGAKHGITSGPLLLCGMCLIGLGLVARALNARKDDQQESQERLRFDQLASGLALVRTGMEASRADLTRVHEATQSVLQLAQTEQASAAEQNRQDAIFRLAASLDQVGAHLDQRLQAQQTAIQGMLQELRQSTLAAQEELKKIAREHPGHATTAQLLGRVMDTRNAHAHEKRVSASERSEHGPGLSAGSKGSLGLLDTLDDFGTMHAKESPGRVQSTARESSAAEGPSAPLPRDSASANPESSNWPPRQSPNGAAESHAFEDAGEISTRDKIELLRALMDDARVREALGGLTGVES